MISITFAKTRENAIIPTKKYPDDAGFDIYSPSVYRIKPHSYILIPTGIMCKFPKDCQMEIRPKGKNPWLIGSGLIEPNYQGEIIVRIINYSNEEWFIKNGDAIGQIYFSFRPIIDVVSITTKEKIFTEVSDRSTSGGIWTIQEGDGWDGHEDE